MTAMFAKLEMYIIPECVHHIFTIQYGDMFITSSPPFSLSYDFYIWANVIERKHQKIITIGNDHKPIVIIEMRII